jgi:hypothetical protein
MEVKFTAEMFVFENSLWYHHFLVPNAIVDQFLALPSAKRVLCTLNGTTTIHCSFMPDGLGGWFIMLNQKLRAQLGLREGSLVDVSLAPDLSEYGLPMPDEFREALWQDEEANRVFEALTPGKKRGLIYQVGNVKSPHIKLRRALVIATHLSTHKTLDYKILNEEFKAANRLGI